MRRYQTGAHTKHDLQVHLVWIPKYRKKVLTGAVAVRVRDLIRQIAMEHEVHIVSGKVARDHVHVLVDLHRTVALAALVQQLKGASAHAWNIERHEPWLRWQSGYWAESVCAEHLDDVASYVRAQRRHHPASESWQLREAGWEPPKGA